MSTSGAPTAIRLLILSTSLDRTEKITTSLRNGGLAVHGTRLSDQEKLEDKLQSGSFDIVLCCAFEEPIDLRTTLDALTDTEKDLPLLVMSDAQGDSEQLLQAMREGARDLVDAGDMEHLQLVVAREFDDLQNRRKLSLLSQRVKETEQRCMGLIESSREAIAFIQDGMHVHVNPAYLELFGVKDAEEIEDLPLLDMIDKAEHKKLRSSLKNLETDSDQRSLTLDTVIRQQNGDTADAGVYLAKASMDGEPCLQVIIRSKRQSARDMEKKLRRLSRLDTDTKLPNRQYFMTQLDHWVDAAEEDREMRALVYLSLDDYGGLKRSLGVGRIDELVKTIAQQFRTLIDKSDLLARFSDSAFSMLCRRPSATEIEQLAETLRQTVEGVDFPDAHPTCSIGIALLTDPHPDSHDLVNEAYKSSENAREQGGNRIDLYINEPTKQPVTNNDNTVADAQDGKVLHQIESALEKGLFQLAFQPIVSLQGDTRENYAVLVRMLGDDEEELLPEFFFKQAAQYGKMVEIDHWIVRNAISALSEQRREGRKVNLFLSLSEASINDKDTLLWVCDCLREFDARGGWLTFQIREKHIRDNEKAVRKLIDGLKKIKCQIAIDHFGLLPKPESVLNRTGADFVKLAPSFVRELNNNQEKQDELNTLNEMILSHGMKTVATSVEDANSLTVLWTVGIGYIQGYFLQEPSETIEYAAQQLL